MKGASVWVNNSWSFNPPCVPHFEDIWEAGIRVMKSHLLCVVWEQVLTFEEIYAIMTQIEAVLNSRPLYFLNSGPHDLSVLTSRHFLVLEPITSLPIIVTSENGSRSDGTQNMCTIYNRNRNGFVLIKMIRARWSHSCCYSSYSLGMFTDAVGQMMPSA